MTKRRNKNQRQNQKQIQNQIQSQYLYSSQNTFQNSNVGASKSLPYMCLLMIVKDEAHVITQTLDILHKYIDYWIICDTGSTDGTQDLIKNYFDEKKIPGELFQHEWVNFGHNRTLAFECAYNKSKYVFVFDADDLIHGNFIINKNLNADAYTLKFGQVYTYSRPQIFKNSLKWRYRGVLHEFADCITKKNCLYIFMDGDYHVESRRLGSRNTDPDKYLKDANTLLKAIEENKDPDLKARYLFYLAQSFRDYKDYPNAIKYYMQRADYGDWPEEAYYSCWQVGLLMYNIDTYTMNDKLHWFMKGYKICPNRGEVLCEIGKIYFNNHEFQKAYSYFEMVSKMNIPKGGLFSDESSYTTTCRLYLSITCLHLNKIEESEFHYNYLLSHDKMTDVDHFNLRVFDMYKMKGMLFKNNINFEEYTFYPYNDVFGSDISSTFEKTIYELYEESKTIENCNAFNTIGYFKNIDLSNYKLNSFLNDRQFLMVNGIYIKNK